MLRSILISGLVMLIIAPAVHATDPICPGFLRTVEVNGPSGITGIDANGSLAITADNRGLSTWDLSDPSNPRWMGSYTYGRGSLPKSDYYFGSDVYLHPSNNWACLTPAFDCFDLRDPSNPQPFRWRTADWPDHIGPNGSAPLTSKGTAFSANLIAVRNFFATVAREVWLLDTLNPGPRSWIKPEILQRRFSWVEDIAFLGDLLLVLDRVGGLIVFDVSDPRKPREVGSAEVAEFTITISPYSINAGEHVAIISLDHDYGGAPEGWVIDLSDVSNPVVHEFSNDLGWDSPSEIREIDFRGDIAIATIARWTTEGRRLFLEEADFSNPEEPRLRASRILDTYVFSIAACPNKTVVGLGTGIAVHNPGATLYLVGRSPDYGSANRFGTGDTSGALANGDIVTFDLNDPGNPTELARLDLDEYYNNLRVTGTTMIAVASGHDTLTTIDFSEPESPVPLDSIVVENLQFDLEVEDDTAYVLGCSFVANESCEISLIDLTDPRNLVIRSNLEIPSPEYGKVSGFRIREGVLFIQTRSSTLPSSFLSVDVTNPAEPTILDEINAGAYEFDLVGDVALLGTSFGIEIVNISNPSELILEHLNSDIRTGLIESVGNGLVSLINSKGCWLSDFTDPDYPITYDTPEISRSWEHGIIIDNVWLRPSQHVIDVVSLECRPPEAEIRASGRGPTIWFEDLSRYQVTERLWDFGDGETSGQLNPVHTYASPGNYTVTLTVSSPNGTDTVIEEIEVGPPRVRGGSRRR